jgi:hypothetical protein
MKGTRQSKIPGRLIVSRPQKKRVKSTEKSLSFSLLSFFLQNDKIFIAILQEG